MKSRIGLLLILVAVLLLLVRRDDWTSSFGWRSTRSVATTVVDAPTGPVVGVTGGLEANPTEPVEVPAAIAVDPAPQSVAAAPVIRHSPTW